MDELDESLELSNAEMRLYSRQILLDGWDIEAQEKLKLANVLIVGCGGIGCMTAELLARAGVGQITLIDADTIEVSNLQRQIAYVENNVGFYKAEVLAQRLKQINPYIKVHAYAVKLDTANASSLILGQDLVLDGCDNFTTRYLVNQQCKAANVHSSVHLPLVFKGSCLWWKVSPLAMNVCSRKKNKRVKAYAVQIREFSPPRQTCWPVFKRTMHSYIWV